MSFWQDYDGIFGEPSAWIVANGKLVLHPITVEPKVSKRRMRQLLKAAGEPEAVDQDPMANLHKTADRQWLNPVATVKGKALKSLQREARAALRAGV